MKERIIIHRYHLLAAASKDIKEIKGSDLRRAKRCIIRGTTQWSD